MPRIAHFLELVVAPAGLFYGIFVGAKRLSSIFVLFDGMLATVARCYILSASITSLCVIIWKECIRHARAILRSYEHCLVAIRGGRLPQLERRELTLCGCVPTSRCVVLGLLLVNLRYVVKQMAMLVV